MKPLGDDFDTRARVESEGEWVNPQEGFITPGELVEEQLRQNDSSEDVDLDEGEDDLLGYAEYFAMLNRFEQRRFLESFRVMATGLVGLTPNEVQLSDDLILDAIQDTLSIDALKELVLQERLVQQRQVISDFTVPAFVLPEDDLLCARFGSRARLPISRSARYQR